MPDPSRSETLSTRLQRIATLAREAPQMPFTSLNHHLDLELLKEAFAQTRKDGATGVDGESAAEYAIHLEANLQALLDRAKSGTYRAPPVRRVHLPKGNGKTRPIGIPTFEDKVLQRAVGMILGAIYEQDFLPCSFGFRPGRSAHQLLESFWKQAMSTGGGFVLEVDIRQFFDSVDHGVLKELLRRRVRDGVLLRLISKWLHAGVLEEGVVTYPERGTPQGGVISPLLANLYLHEVIDVWFEREIRPRLKQAAHLFRYADDVVILFSGEEDARRVHAVLPKRLAKAGLVLHPDKTRLVDFRRPRWTADRDRDPPVQGPGTFALLGFTHFWARSRKGHWAVTRKTAKDRLGRALRAIKEWCRRFRHRPVREQWQQLSAKLRGHYAYYGIVGNHRSLSRFRHFTERIWQRWLNRRSHAGLTWEVFHRIQQRYPLPPPRLLPARVTLSVNR